MISANNQCWALQILFQSMVWRLTLAQDRSYPGAQRAWPSRFFIALALPYSWASSPPQASAPPPPTMG